MRLSLFIFFHFLKPLLMTSFVLFGLMMLYQFYQLIPFLEIVDIRLFELGTILFLSIPFTLFSILPLCCLIAIMIGLNSLSHNSEIIAIDAAGISRFFFLKPLYSLIVIIAMITALLSIYIAPLSLSKLEDYKRNLVNNAQKINIKTGEFNYFESIVFFAHKKKDTSYYQIFLAPKNNRDFVILAKEAQLEYFSKKNLLVLLLLDGQINQLKKVDQNQLSQIKFERLEYPLNTQNLNAEKTEARYRSKQHDRFNFLLSKLEASLTFEEMLYLLSVLDETKSTRYHEIRAEFFSRFIPPLSCFALSIFALLFGITNPRFPSKKNIFLAMFAVIFYYYMKKNLHFASDAGELNPFVFYLLPVSYFLIGLMLFWKNNR